MPEEKVLVSGEKPEGEKLGPNATLVAEDVPEYVQVFGITFKRGESVNVVELLGEGNSKRVLQKLANHPQFEVDGGKKTKERQGNPQKLAEMQAASQQVLQAQNEALSKGQEPPEGYDAPMQAVLENPAGKPRGQSDEHASEQGQQQRRSNPPRGR